MNERHARRVQEAWEPLERRNLEWLVSSWDFINFKGRYWINQLLKRRPLELSEAEVARISRIRAIEDWEFN